MLFKVKKNIFNWRYLFLSPFFGRDSPQWARASSFSRFIDHTQRCTTVGRTPLDKWSARRRDLYLTTHNADRQTSNPPVGFEPTISAGERPQTKALDHATTVTGVLPLEYLIMKLPIPTQPATVSLFKVKSCKALLHMLQVNIRSYLKSVLRCTFLILDTYQPASIYRRQQRCEYPWLFFEAKRGPREKEIGEHWSE
jgi:hypothetical protein